jgi:hypothetical protein
MVHSDGADREDALAACPKTLRLPRRKCLRYRGRLDLVAFVPKELFVGASRASDLSFSYQKIDLHWSADHPTPPRVEKQSSEAQVAH